MKIIVSPHAVIDEINFSLTNMPTIRFSGRLLINGKEADKFHFQEIIDTPKSDFTNDLLRVVEKYFGRIEIE